MKIGIDGFGYFDGYSSLQRVISNFINYLLSNDSTNEYVLFLDKRFEQKKFPVPQGARISFRYLKTGSLRYNLFIKIFALPYFSYRDKIDIFITQYYPSPFSRGKRISLIYDILFESYPELFTSRERYQLRPQKLLARMSHGIITISESEKNRLLEYKYARKPEQIAVFHLASEERFKPKATFSDERIQAVKIKYDLPDEYLLYVGLLSGRKNLDNLLRALPLLKVSTRLVITGERHTTYSSNHLSIIEELGLEKRVQFTGFVDDNDLSIIYSLAKIFCFPSLAEGFGLPPLEAMSAGIPVVVSNRTSLPEVCGEAGVYFEPTRPDDIARAINELLTDSVFYASKKSSCLHQASKFNYNDSANKLIGFFNSIGKV